METSPTLRFPSTPIRFPATPALHQAWSTPAFLKRDRLSTTSFFGSDYDPFNEDDFRDNNRRKKTKFGRSSNEWRFTEQSSSPESISQGEHSALEQSVTVENQVNGQERITGPQTPNGNRPMLSATNVATSVMDHVTQSKDDPGAESHGIQRQSGYDLAERDTDEQIADSNLSDRTTVQDESGEDHRGSEAGEPAQQQENTIRTEEGGLQPAFDPPENPPVAKSDIVNQESRTIPGQSKPLESRSNRVQFVEDSALLGQPDTEYPGDPPQDRALILSTEVPLPQLRPGKLFRTSNEDEEEKTASDAKVAAAGSSRPEASVEIEADRLGGAAGEHDPILPPSGKAWEALEPHDSTFGMPDEVANDAASMDNEATFSKAPSGDPRNDRGPISASPESTGYRQLSPFSLGPRSRLPELGFADHSTSAMERRASTEKETPNRSHRDEGDISAPVSNQGTELLESTSRHDFASGVGVYEDSSKMSDSTAIQTRDVRDTTNDLAPADVEDVENRENTRAQGVTHVNEGTLQGTQDHDLKDQALATKSSPPAEPDLTLSPRQTAINEMERLSPPVLVTSTHSDMDLQVISSDDESDMEELPMRPAEDAFVDEDEDASRLEAMHGEDQDDQEGEFEDEDEDESEGEVKEIEDEERKAGDSMDYMPEERFREGQEDRLSDEEWQSDGPNSDIIREEEELIRKRETRDGEQGDRPPETVDEVQNKAQDEDQSKERQEPAEAQRSEIQVISIDDSDDDSVGVEQSQTDGAAVSALASLRQQSLPRDSLSLSPIKRQDSPWLPSPRMIPSTVQDSQKAVGMTQEELLSDHALSQAEEDEVRLSYNPSTHDSESETSPDQSPSNKVYPSDALPLPAHLDEEPLASEVRATSPPPDATIGIRLGSPSQDTIIGDKRDPRLKNQVLTPQDTQQREDVSQRSNISMRSINDTHDLPTPRLTQNRSSDILLPASLRYSSPAARSLYPKIPPAESPPPKSVDSSPDLADQLKKLETEARTPQKAKPTVRRISNIPASVSPWFAPKRSSEVVPDSRDQSDREGDEQDAESPIAASLEGDVNIEDIEEEIPSSSLEPPADTTTPIKLNFHRVSPSPLTSPSLLSPPLGLRTSHAYYAPLSTLSSHFGSQTSTSSIVLGATTPSRASSGPRDFSTTIFLTDPSALSHSNNKNNRFEPLSPTSAFTLATIFRPVRASLPRPCPAGSVLLLRNFKVQHTARAPSLISTADSAWALFLPPSPHHHHPTSEPIISGPPVEFGPEECGYVRGLWEWWDQVPSSTKDATNEEVEKRIEKIAKRQERERLKGRRLKGMGIRLAPGEKVGKTGHELRGGKEWKDDGTGQGEKGSPRRGGRRAGGRGSGGGEGELRHELRDGKEWVDVGSSPTGKGKG